ncbi:hypothetical protein [Lachnobacterium bovis]|uniref:hypothetical protein n=1 Tax=Lachnobacterium bovis TaxID=140626 RepID=UPI00048DB270|nr:hypothetical protein [Lachnobacterium bovis]
MENSKKFQTKLNEKIKENCQYCLVLSVPVLVALFLSLAMCGCRKTNITVISIVLSGILIQFFSIRAPFLEIGKTKKLKKRVLSGESLVEVEKRKIKSFDLNKDIIEDQYGNIVQVDYTTGVEYYYLAGENEVILVTVEKKIYAFSVNRF